MTANKISSDVVSIVASVAPTLSAIMQIDHPVAAIVLNGIAQIASGNPESLVSMLQPLEDAMVNLIKNHFSK